MKKLKIAISLDKPLVDLIDTKVDGVTFRSRSQAIEFFVEKSLKDELISTAVIFLKGEHQKYSIMKLKGKTLLERQMLLLTNVGISKTYIITQKSQYYDAFLKEANKFKQKIDIVLRKVNGTGQALYAMSDVLTGKNFIAMSGDIFNDFNLHNMINKHMSLKKVATLGLMTRTNPESFGSVILDGELIVEFSEKLSTSKSPVVNAGIYVFSPRIFNYLDDSTISLEKDLFPRLAKINQLIGFFTYGDYIHMEEL
jgi:NDP-sugar pyrophosphorylase family protein